MEAIRDELPSKILDPPPDADIGLLPFRRTKSSTSISPTTSNIIKDIPTGDKSIPMKELCQRLRDLINSRPSDGMRSHLPEDCDSDSMRGREGTRHWVHGNWPVRLSTRLHPFAPAYHIYVPAEMDSFPPIRWRARAFSRSTSGPSPFNAVSGKF
ncbi:hypothetical protein HNY73_010437 [Argiope bruennichi]|uniref:Uncharacterized protein n=1 Tax=Argiope bruennichi TaxID=94029 RepID=A0A8T0F3F8_ARGBR|nr:hypothetical protein HNY73_010437 [Argiope bruennichi]